MLWKKSLSWILQFLRKCGQLFIGREVFWCSDMQPQALLILFRSNCTFNFNSELKFYNQNCRNIKHYYRILKGKRVEGRRGFIIWEIPQTKFIYLWGFSQITFKNFTRYSFKALLASICRLPFVKALPQYTTY